MYSKIHINSAFIKYFCTVGQQIKIGISKSVDLFRNQLAEIFGVQIPNVFDFVIKFGEFVKSPAKIEQGFDRQRIAAQNNQVAAADFMVEYEEEEKTEDEKVMQRFEESSALSL